MKEFMFVAVDAFNTREDCLWDEDRRAETIKADLKEGRTPAVVVSVCLPDTIDPRGPKTNRLAMVDDREVMCPCGAITVDALASNA